LICNELKKIVRSTRRYEPTWRYLFNFAPTLAYRFNRQALDGEAARVLADLNRKGVAVTTAQALLGTSTCYRELETAVDGLENELAGALATARASANDQDTAGQKTFIYELLDRYPVFDPGSIYARFALQQPIMQIANAYFGMLTRLRYYNVWHTFATHVKPRESQLWHRDREDHLILKAFVYMRDVDEGTGPFTYAPSTHPKGARQQEAEYFVEGKVKRTTDEQMAKVIPAEQWVKGVGERGTIVFADTRGYHKGGLARERDRLMYTCMFTSQASESEEFMRRTKEFALPGDRAQAFALTPRKRGVQPHGKTGER